MANLFKRYSLLCIRKLIKPQIVKLDNVQIFIDKSLSCKMLNVLFQGKYEQYEIAIIKNILDQNDIVLEIGTGLGLISCYCAKIIGSEKVFTFEANPELEKIIRYNYKLNNVEPKLEIGVLGGFETEVEFYIEPDIWSSSLYKRSANSKKITVPVLNVNEVIINVNPSFLIVDIEGGEFDLFRHISHFRNIKKIAIEIHKRVIGDAKLEFIRSQLAENGFEIDLNLSTEGNLLFLK